MALTAGMMVPEAALINATEHSGQLHEKQARCQVELLICHLITVCYSYLCNLINLPSQSQQIQPMRENSCESVSGCSHSTLRKVEMATAATNTAPASPRCNGSALGAGRGGGDRTQAQQVIYATFCRSYLSLE